MQNLPRKGIWPLAGFYKWAQRELQRIVKNKKFRDPNSKAEFKEGSEYVIAKEYLDLVYGRYGEETVKEFVKFLTNPKYQEIVNDQVVIELQKVMTCEEIDAIKHKHHANGLASIVKFAEKLESYKIVVQLFENKHRDIQERGEGEDLDPHFPQE